MLFQPKHHNLFMFDAPADGGEGGGSGTTGTDPAKATTEEKKFSQAELDQIVKDRLAREKEQAQKAAEKLKADAEAAAAVKNGEWEKLAKQRETELADALKKAADAEVWKAAQDELTKALQGNVDAQIKAYPDAVQSLIKKLPVLDQLKWITENPASAAAPAKQPGPGALPVADAGKPLTNDELVSRKRAEYGAL